MTALLMSVVVALAAMLVWSGWYILHLCLGVTTSISTVNQLVKFKVMVVICSNAGGYCLDRIVRIIVQPSTAMTIQRYPYASCRPVLRTALTLSLTLLLNLVFGQPPYTGFIRVNQGRFVDSNCLEFKFSGWNAWKTLDYATNKAAPPGYSSGQEFIRDLFKRANSSGLNLLRAFTSGSFNEYAFQGLDFILDEADKAGIKLVLVPLNLWKPNGGVPQFEKWCGTDQVNTSPVSAVVRSGPLNATERVQTPYWWYINPGCRDMYKDYLRGLVLRRNSINGRLYRDDPTIFAWNLLNEPRCRFCEPQAVTDWYLDMAQFLKSIDPNHMVTTGEEGLFAYTSPYEPVNPYRRGYRWADFTGQDFIADHNSSNIDYAVIHLWPDNWSNQNLTFGRSWIEAHMEAAESLGKPLMLEEFGKNAVETDIATVRDPWFQLVYGMVSDSLRSGGALRGALFWQWEGFGTAPRTDNGSNIRETDTTFTNYIRPFSHRMAAGEGEDGGHTAAATVVPGCIPVAPSTPSLPRPSVLPPNTSVVSAGRRLLLA